ncbi:tryptophan-rich sensory protein, partial [Listeria monocytogenes]|nr:tryptophan-rich sensory protein [Listeria monocytogenes]
MKFLIWLVCVIGIEATGIISSLFAGDIAGTYAQMEKPFLAPPGG